MSDLKHLEKLVLAWAKDRNIIKGSTIQHQFLKLSEEFGELNWAILLSEKAGIKDGVGDFVVVIINITQQLGLGSIKGCLNKAIAEPELTKGLMQLSMRISAEMGRLSAAIIRGRSFKAAVAIGNCLRLLQAVARYAEVGTLEDCLAAAYEEIKDRDGEMVENVWVKKSDLGKVGK